MMTSLSAKVIGLRKAKGMNLPTLAELSQVSKGYLSAIQKEQSVNPGMSVLKGLAKALDVSVDYLVDDSTTEKRSWEKVAVDESLRLFLNRNDLPPDDVEAFSRVSFQPTAPRTVRDWERLKNNLSAFRRVRRRPAGRRRIGTRINPASDNGSDDMRDR